MVDEQFPIIDRADAFFRNGGARVKNYRDMTDNALTNPKLNRNI